MLGSSVDGRRDRTETTQDSTMTDQAPQTSQDDPTLPPPPAEREAPPAIGDTIGTGTSIALGCVAATLLLIVLGLLFIVVMTVLN
jgi:hypothetical protein